MVKKILVVDDEENIRKLIETRLKANQYNVITASNGAEALEKAESEAPDLILLDIMMPELDGLEVLRKLKSKFEQELKPGTKVISYVWPIKGWTPVKIDECKGSPKMYLYTKYIPR